MGVIPLEGTEEAPQLAEDKAVLHCCCLNEGHRECCDFCKISRCWTSSKLGAVSAVRELMLRCYIIYICSCLMRELQDVIFSTSQVSAVSCEMSLPMTNQNEAAGDGMIQPQWYAECELHAS